MNNDWIVVFNKVFPLITEPLKETAFAVNLEVQNDNPAYFSGSRFIRALQEFNPEVPHWKEFISLRIQKSLSTSRREYFYDLLKAQTSTVRTEFLERILSSIEEFYPREVADLKGLLLGTRTVLAVTVGSNFWNAERLNKMVQEIDKAIVAEEYERAVTLCYTCVEGIFKGFILVKIPRESELNEIVKMSRVLKTYLKDLNLYPEEVCNSVIVFANLVNSARNQFSESHFNGLAARELAVYVRDLTSATTKLVLSQAL